MKNDLKEIIEIIEMIEEMIKEEKSRNAYNKSKIRIAYLQEVIDKIVERYNLIEQKCPQCDEYGILKKDVYCQVMREECIEDGKNQGIYSKQD